VTINGKGIWNPVGTTCSQSISYNLLHIGIPPFSWRSMWPTVTNCLNVQNSQINLDLINSQAGIQKVVMYTS
jgi:hypothetical protein